ncbi:hypothetical protein BH09MYX1_BH09MYX1_57250 [soil metagenome]
MYDCVEVDVGERGLRAAGLCCSVSAADARAFVEAR